MVSCTIVAFIEYDEYEQKNIVGYFFIIYLHCKTGKFKR
jgi:hypothetical protein